MSVHGGEDVDNTVLACSVAKNTRIETLIHIRHERVVKVMMVILEGSGRYQVHFVFVLASRVSKCLGRAKAD